jgi:hypothetical protein
MPTTVSMHKTSTPRAHCRQVPLTQDLVVCSKCGGAHQDVLHHFNCSCSDKHKGRGCNCPPSCFLCITRGNHKAAEGHTSTLVTYPIQKHFCLAAPDPEGIILIPTTYQCSMTILLTPGMNVPMNILIRDNIRNLSKNGMSTEAIIHLLIPTDIANMVTTHTTLST